MNLISKVIIFILLIPLFSLINPYGVNLWKNSVFSQLKIKVSISTVKSKYIHDFTDFSLLKIICRYIFSFFTIITKKKKNFSFSFFPTFSFPLDNSDKGVIKQIILM